MLQYGTHVWHGFEHIALGPRGAEYACKALGLGAAAPARCAVQVSAIFGSSLEVMVSVFGESPYAGAGSSAHVNGGGADDAGGGGGGIFHCADAFVTVVAVDERHGTPVTVGWGGSCGGRGGVRGRSTAGVRAAQRPGAI